MIRPLQARSISKQFLGRPVLVDISLAIEAGDVVALKGPNGAGKSTFMGCLCGAVIPDIGQIEIAGHDLQRDPLAARAAIRYLPQEIAVPSGLTARELLRFWADVYGDSSSIDDAIQWLPHPEYVDHLATTHSVGMRKQLAFSGLMFGTATLFVLDEPFAGVDSEGRTRMAAFLRAKAEAGAGVLLSVHDAETSEVERLGARVFEIPPLTQT